MNTHPKLYMATILGAVARYRHNDPDYSQPTTYIKLGDNVRIFQSVVPWIIGIAGHRRME